MTRKDLDAKLIAEGYFLQNIPRALQALSRRHLVFLRYGHSREDTIVRLPEEIRVLSDADITAILKQLGGGK